MTNFCSSWNPFEDIPHDEVEGIILQAERVEQFPCRIKPKPSVVEAKAGAEDSVGSSPEHATDQIQRQLNFSSGNGNFCTREKIRKLKEVGLGEEDLFFIRNNYKNSENMDDYLAKLNDEQRELCLRIKKATRLAANQQNIREKKNREIEMLELRQKESRARLEAEREKHQALKDRLGYVKRAKCDLLEEFCARARAEGTEIPEWVQNM